MSTRDLWSLHLFGSSSTASVGDRRVTAAPCGSWSNMRGRGYGRVILRKGERVKGGGREGGEGGWGERRG